MNFLNRPDLCNQLLNKILLMHNCCNPIVRIININRNVQSILYNDPHYLVYKMIHLVIHIYVITDIVEFE